MTNLPDEWRMPVKGDPDGEFRRAKALVVRHRTTKARRGRVQSVRRFLRRHALWSLILIGFAAPLGWRMLSLKPLAPPPHLSVWPVEIKAKHQAAARSCDAARAVGLAPATKGYPGYWPHLDMDNDGMSCEWSFGIAGISLQTLMSGK